MRRVVVTGIGVVSPIGTSVREFFAGLREARSGIDEIRRFDASGLVTRIAGEVRGLDPDRMAFPERWTSALLRDPKAVFGIMAGREAICAAFGERRPFGSYEPNRVGASFATGLEICHVEDLADFVHGGALDISGLHADLMLARGHDRFQIPSHLAARCLAAEAGVRGPFSINVSACTAGAQAIGEALWAIRDGEIDAAIAGGYDSMINPLGVGGFCLLRAMSTANHLRGAASRPFDRRRDGFVLGEGAAMLILEELECAKRRGATLIAELYGYGTTMDAYRVSDPHPEALGACQAMISALADARLQPEDIDYINAHGTATLKNDIVESSAIRQVFGPAADRVPVSSTKSQIGHLIGAAGAVELLSGIFALQEGLLPATLNLTEPDPACDLDHVTCLPRPARVQAFLSNSFGFGGQNASLVAGVVR